MKEGWTGGQYSLFRVLFGAYLVCRFWSMAADPRAWSLLPSIQDGVPGIAPLALGVIASLAFALGRSDRVAALVAWCAGLAFVGWDPPAVYPGLPYVGWLLLVHACLPPAPFGSWDARGRADPRGGWGMPRIAWGGAWALMTAGYAFSGIAMIFDATPAFGAATWLVIAIQLTFAPLALFRRTRAAAWCALLLLQFALLTLFRVTDLALGMICLHLFTFDPQWLPPRPVDKPETLFFDGTCGLCHATVRFLLAEDRAGAFVYAPLGGVAFDAAFSETERKGLPDSVVVRTNHGRTLVRSSAVIHLLDGIGGAWRVVAVLLRVIPRPIRDFGYDRVAAVRKRLFASPKDVCPLMPPELRVRFLG